jgi:peptidyl-Lys metalloendopeptidase
LFGQFPLYLPPEHTNLISFYSTAYVYPDQFGHVYLCGQYLAANMTGSDSKAGTIVHESTHFTINGGTEDTAYGAGPAQELARTNATAAVGNADSHEFFAENTPKLA